MDVNKINNKVLNYFLEEIEEEEQLLVEWLINGDDDIDQEEGLISIMNANFTQADDKKLIEYVSKYPYLYDLAHKHYKSTVLRDNAWKEIGQYIKKSGENCKKRWKHIRDSHRRRQRKATRSADPSKHNRPLGDLLTFLNKVDHKRKSTSNITIANVNDGEEVLNLKEVDYKNVSHNQNSQPKKLYHSNLRKTYKPQNEDDRIVQMFEERKDRTQIMKGLLNKNDFDDDVKLFFLSVASTVKKMKPDTILKAKLRTLQIIKDLQEEESMANERLNTAVPISTIPLSTTSQLQSNRYISTFQTPALNNFSISPLSQSSLKRSKQLISSYVPQHQ